MCIHAWLFQLVHVQWCVTVPVHWHSVMRDCSSTVTSWSCWNRGRDSPWVLSSASTALQSRASRTGVDGQLTNTSKHAKQYSMRQDNSAVVPPARTTKYGLKSLMHEGPGCGIACQTSQNMLILFEDFFGTGMAQGVTVLHADTSDNELMIQFLSSMLTLSMLCEYFTHTFTFSFILYNAYIFYTFQLFLIIYLFYVIAYVYTMSSKSRTS